MSEMLHFFIVYSFFSSLTQKKLNKIKNWNHNERKRGKWMNEWMKSQCF